MKKRIILLNESGFNSVFTEAFRNENFEVISILETPFIYKKTFWGKLMNIFYRIFLNNNNFFGEDYHKKLNHEVYKRLKKINVKSDYTLIFNANYYSKKIIKNLRKKSNLLVSYQYDGWAICYNIIKHKNYFDRVFFFDKDDLPRFGDNALPLTNCYFSNDNDEKKTPISCDIFYIGNGNKTRIQYIKNLYHEISNKFSLIANIMIPKYQKEENIGGGGKIISQLYNL